MSTVSPGGVQSLHRSLDLLEAVSAHGVPTALGELAQEAGVPVTTAHRLLRTLLERGYVRQLPDRRYVLGFSLVPLGSTATALLGETAGPVLADLVTELGESANLAVLAGHRAEYVAQAPSRHAMRMFTQVGQRVDLHSTGVGKALLAPLATEEVTALLARTGMRRHTEHTLCTRDDLGRALTRAREQGYAVDEEEQELGVRCVAVPVPGAGVPLAVSVSGPPSRVTDAVLARAVPALQSAARRLVGVGDRGATGVTGAGERGPRPSSDSA